VTKKRLVKKFKNFFIVDGYSGANQFAPIVAKRYPNVSVFHVQSKKPIPSVYVNSFRSSDYIRNFVYDGNIDRLVRDLSSLSGESIVVAGIESGVQLADTLSERLSSKTNGAELSGARRNKFEMYERVTKFNVSTGKIQRIDSVANIPKIDFFPCVVKPTESAGSDGIFICDNPDEALRATKSLLGKVNKLGIKNDSLVAQQFIGGLEYAVNSVSFDGENCYSTIWEYHKVVSQTGAPIYDWERLVPFNSEEAQKLAAAHDIVTKALGIKWGASHGEYKLYNDTAILIEVASRIDGIANAKLENEITTQGQIQMGLDCYLDSMTSYRREFQIKMNARNIALINCSGTRILTSEVRKFVKSLPSYIGDQLREPKSGEQRVTTDIFSSPGFIFLAHKDEKQIVHDHLAIREAEKSGKFSVS